MPSFFSKIRGTFSTLFQLGGQGPQLKNNAGVVEHRDNLDAAYVVARGADPAIADDFVTKRYGDANYGAGSIDPPHVVASNAVIAAGSSRTVSRYVEISAGITLEIGANGDLEIG